MPDWRLIPLLQAPGPVQMALDRGLLQAHRQGQLPAIVRFYTWQPAAISLGYHQHRVPDHWAHLRWQGEPLPLVRRPTGGRAVLHQGDLTYAVITSGLRGDRATVYRHLCEFLIAGWQQLGVPLHYGQAGRGYIHNPNCFGTATQADLVLPDGTKLIGSAQLRQGHAILQHGSIRLAPDPDLFAQVFGTPLSPPTLPFPPPQTPAALQPIVQALATAAQHCFGGTWVEQPLSATEWAAIAPTPYP